MQLSSDTADDGMTLPCIAMMCNALLHTVVSRSGRSSMKALRVARRCSRSGSTQHDGAASSDRCLVVVCIT
jgi:hypothetical protein